MLAQTNVRPYNVGLWAAVRCRCTRLAIGLLRVAFRFDRWHAAAPYCCRAYKQLVVQLANATNPKAAVELGCGLGDIISRVCARERVGIDLDRRVIRAARFMHPRGRWIVGDSSAVAGVIAPQQIDCLLMVNWTHMLSAEELAGIVLPLLEFTRFVIVDAIDADAPKSYRHRHDFSFLAGHARQVSSARVAGEPRAFLVFESLR